VAIISLLDANFEVKKITEMNIKIGLNRFKKKGI
jgi:hypothetical protein